MKATSLGPELGFALLLDVGLGKQVVLEVGQGPVSQIFVMPFVIGGGGKHAGCLKGIGEEVEDSLVGDGIIAFSGKELGFTNESPDIFEGGVGRRFQSVARCAQLVSSSWSEMAPYVLWRCMRRSSMEMLA